MTSLFHNKDFYYNDLTKSITDAIWDLMSKGIDEFMEYEPWEYPILLSEEYDERLVYWEFRIARAPANKDFNRDFDIWASAGYNESGELGIAVTVILPKGKWIKKHNVSYSELFGVIAHELHHLSQNASGIDTSAEDIECERLQYFLSQSEIEAFHIGFRAQCALSGEDMEVAIRNYLQLHKLSCAQIDKISSAWMSPSFTLSEQNII